MSNQTEASGQDGAAERIAGGNGRCPGQDNELQWALKTDGYVIVRDVLSREEVRFLRSAAREYLRTSRYYDYGGKFEVVGKKNIPHIETVISSETVQRFLARMTEPFAFRFEGVCDLAINTTSQWHKDAHFSVDIDGHAFTSEEFALYKAAFYLQDQDETARTTLKVRPGSHLLPGLTDLPVKKAVVRAGDMIVFDVRIDHLGQLPTLTDRMLRRGLAIIGRKFPIDAQKAFTQARSAVRWIHPGAGDRMAIFMTFGPCRAGAPAGRMSR